jgi:uncharacterized membrane protein
MNKILRTATILSWINMIFWGLICLILLLGVLASGAMAMLIVLIFPSAIVLHSYASFQLQKSIKNPSVPLNSQTSTGIRFIGFVALFVGISLLVQGISTVIQPHTYLQQWQDYIKSLQSQMGVKSIAFTPSIPKVIAMGVFSLLIGLCVAVNVNFNFRLLRWYLFIKNNSNNQEK